MFFQNLRSEAGKTSFTVRWNSLLFIDSKLSAVQAPGDEWASGSACFCAFSLQYICDAGADRRFLYASFTLQTHHNSVVFQASQYVYEHQLPQWSDVTQSPCPGTDESRLHQRLAVVLHHKAEPALPSQRMKFTASGGYFVFYGGFSNINQEWRPLSPHQDPQIDSKTIASAFFRTRTMHPWS